MHAALNRARFELGSGKYADPVLQAEWNRGGAHRLVFEVLELVKERVDADFDYARELKDLEQIHRELQGRHPMGAWQPPGRLGVRRASQKRSGVTASGSGIARASGLRSFGLTA